MAKKISTVISDEGLDIVEPILDEGAQSLMKDIFGIAIPEITSNIPVLKSVKSAVDIYGAIRVRRLNSRMDAFARALKSGDFNIDDFTDLSAKDQVSLVDTIVTELDSHNDDLQSIALGCLFNAYVSGRIDRLIFTGVSHELKNTNPLVFYFNVSSYKTKSQLPVNSNGADFGFTKRNLGTTVDSGPIEYLPAAFISNSSGGMQFSTDMTLTNLGEAFFDHVYHPMKKTNDV